MSALETKELQKSSQEYMFFVLDKIVPQRVLEVLYTGFFIFQSTSFKQSFQELCLAKETTFQVRTSF